MGIAVSIIVPVYNVVHYVAECLESLKAQTLDNLEILVVDDGSSDGSSEICKRFCNDCTQFRYIRKENGGLMSAWVTGVLEAQGDYVGFVDSDDWVDREMYQQMFNAAVLHNADIVMCAHRRVFKENIIEPNTTGETRVYLTAEQLDKIKEHAFSALVDSNISNERWNKIFRKKLISSNLKYCKDLSRFHEAKYITPACILDCTSFVFIDKAFYNLRARKGSNGRIYKKDIVSWTEHLYNVQKEMLCDKHLEDLSPRLENAKLDYFRIVWSRCSNISYTDCRRVCKELLSAENKRIVKNNKHQLIEHGGLTGKLMFITFAYLPFLMPAAMKLMNLKKHNKANEEFD